MGSSLVPFTISVGGGVSNWAVLCMLLHAFFGKEGPRPPPPLFLKGGGAFSEKGGPNLFCASMNAQIPE